MATCEGITVKVKAIELEAIFPVLHAVVEWCLENQGRSNMTEAETALMTAALALAAHAENKIKR